ncbi:hypothetical protein C0989_004448 [Termitomyces sp. Mn162]|nr:hypothetical protein C0989_004448 [Termitomyces sp. Mn162]
MDWCILEGGGMAGKTIEESRMAHLAYYKAKDKDQKKINSKVMITPSGSLAFTLEGNPDFITAYMAAQEEENHPAVKAEFMGLASNALPIAGSIEEVEALEFDTLIVLEEEPEA